MNKYKIVIRGGYGLYNFGDDALIVALYQYLINNGLSKEDVALMCVPSKYLHRQLDNPLLIDYNAIKSDISIDHLIYGGGTQFYSFNSQNSKKLKELLLKNPFDIFQKIRNRIIIYYRKRFIENKFEIADYAKNIYQIGIGVGPFMSKNSKIENKTADLFRRSKYLSVRDEFSYAKCKEWGAHNFVQSPDLCYIMDISKYQMNRVSVRKIAVIVRDWNHTGASEYYDKVSSFVEEYRIKGYEVQYISLDKKSDKFWTKFLNAKNENFIQWDSDKMTFENFYEKLSQFDLVITARFHGAVFASMMNIPFITIEVEQKLRMIAEKYSGGAYVWTNKFDLDELDEHVSKIEGAYESHKEIVESVSRENRNIVTNQYKYLLKSICQ